MISLIITIALIGFLLWLAETYIPMAAPFKTVLRIVVVVCLILYLLRVFGVLDFADVPVPRLR